MDSRVRVTVCTTLSGVLVLFTASVALGQTPATDSRQLETAVDLLAPPIDALADAARSPLVLRDDVRGVVTPGTSPSEIEAPRSHDLGIGLAEKLRQVSGTQNRNTRGPRVSPNLRTSSTDDHSNVILASAEDHARLRMKVRQVLDSYTSWHLNSRDHNPWEMMHAIVAYGVDTELHRNGDKGELVNAISYVCWNGPCHGIRLLQMEGNRVAAAKGPYVQGHHGQFLAILAQSRVPSNYPLRVGSQQFTLEDLIESEKLGCRPNTELTFKLISLAHYLPSDATWKSSDGQEWSIDRLISEEIKQPITEKAACGGTHRLFGLYYAVHKREKAGLPITGEFARAEKYTHDYHRYTFALQNSDGSFSTEWFKRRGNEADMDRRLKTTGHILEWITFTLPDDQLNDPRYIKAVDYISTILLKNRNHTWEIGPLGHSLHALNIYESRMAQRETEQHVQTTETPTEVLTERPKSSRAPVIETAPVVKETPTTAAGPQLVRPF